MSSDTELTPEQRNTLKSWSLLYLGTFIVTIGGSIVLAAYLLWGTGHHWDTAGMIWIAVLVAVFVLRRYCVRRIGRIRKV